MGKRGPSRFCWQRRRRRRRRRGADGAAWILPLAAFPPPRPCSCWAATCSPMQPAQPAQPQQRQPGRPPAVGAAGGGGAAAGAHDDAAGGGACWAVAFVQPCKPVVSVDMIATPCSAPMYFSARSAESCTPAPMPRWPAPAAWAGGGRLAVGWRRLGSRLARSATTWPGGETPCWRNWSASHLDTFAALQASGGAAGGAGGDTLLWRAGCGRGFLAFGRAQGHAAQHSAAVLWSGGMQRPAPLLPPLLLPSK